MRRVIPSADKYAEVPPVVHHRGYSALGFLYTWFTVGCGFYYLSIVSSHAMTDYWWRDYNVSGVQTFVAQIFHNHLLGAAPSLDLAAPGTGISASFAAPSTVIAQSVGYARKKLLANYSTSLPDIVTVLRAGGFGASRTFFAPLCWVDFERSMELALSAARQTRCAAMFGANAALYFEPIARNCDKATFTSSPDAAAYTKSIFYYNASQAWFSATFAMPRLSVAGEVTYWADHGVTTWQTQLQNLFQNGITETISVVSALGRHQAVTINAAPYVMRDFGLWTTVQAYAGMWNIVGQAADSARRLVRNRPGFVDADWDGLNPGVAVNATRTAIGPFGSIDLLAVPLPPSLVTLFWTVQTTVFAAVAAGFDGVEVYSALGTVQLTPTPPDWQLGNVSYYGGNPLCTAATGVDFALDGFGYYDGCATTDALTIRLRQMSALFAVTAVGATATSISAACALSSSSLTACEALLTDALTVYHAIPALETLAPLVTAAAADVAAISMVQMVLLNATTPAMFYQRMVPSTATDPWAIYGWVTLCDWISGFREVYTMLGDVGDATLMTREEAPTPLAASATEVPSSACTYVSYIIYYVSGAFTAVVVVMTVMGLTIRGNVLGYNLLQVNRVVGPVWIGRPFLFLRAMSAIMLLSTASIVLVDTHGVTRFVTARRNLIESAVVAGEATWLTYVFNDVLVPFTGEYTRYYAPVSTAVSWLVHFATDAVSPVIVETALQSNCTTLVVGQQIQCTGGTLYIGNFSRLVALMLLNVGSVLGTFGILYALYPRIAPHRRLATSFEPHLSIAAPSHAFLAKQPGDEALMDEVCCVMSGMVPLKRTSLFDTKLWVSLTNVSSEREGYLLHGASFRYHAPPHPDLHKKAPTSKNLIAHVVMGWQANIRVRALVGCAYLVSTLLGSYTYLVLTSSKMSNDFWWEGFNSTAHQTFVANWYNTQLLLTSRVNGTVALDTTAYSDASQMYGTSTAQVATAAFYTTALQLEANTVPNVIASLRSMDGCAIPWIFTAYCWVDFDRMWSVAATAARQTRCSAAQTTNGAAYLEAMVRNVDLVGFLECWAPAWTQGILGHLKTTTAGSEWWAAVQAANGALSVADEAHHWVTAGVIRYTSQWQNFKRLGLVETFAIQNAFGYAYPLTLKSSNGSLALATETSMQLYWGWASDLNAVGVNGSGATGSSLVRDSATFIYANATPADLYAANGTLALPMGAPFALLVMSIGPFGSIDATRVGVPALWRGLRASMNTLLSEMLTASVELQAAVTALANPGSFTILPTPWMQVNNFYSSTILCDSNTVSDTVQPFFTATGSCTYNSLEQLQSSTLDVLQAVVLTGLVHETTSNATLQSICTHESLVPSDCATLLVEAVALLHKTMVNVTTNELVATGQVVRSIIQQDVGLEIIQTLYMNGSAELSRLPFFDDADPTMDLFAWLYVMDWVSGKREVITITGDRGSLTTMSTESIKILTAANALELPTSLSTYIRSAIQYITVLLVLVSTMVLGYIGGTRGYIEGMNMLELNRVAGIVWVGRPFLALRGMTAICLLSTAKLDMARSGKQFYLASEATAWYTTVLASGEMGWLVYIINDVFSVWSAEYTMGYAVKSGIVAWGASGLWSLVSPVAHSATIDRTCSLDVVDYQAVCNAGVVAIGSFNRLCGLVGLAFCSALFCYVVERFQHPQLRGLPGHAESLLLSSPGRYMFEKEHWEGHGVYYMDKASGAINGVLSVEWGDRLYLFDIKMWRKYCIDRARYPALADKATIRAIPLIAQG
ncbi:hypothetical protein ACHHYP_13562 [Achlya hypogyna]|uniref:Uncharacterized protein n=1 Tax=Achlya hypogyna TaxID=1202772 RepID=A0A1V9YF91_ACHHY|nr:hypothetical protein ACHHYP_13562 [Achlya hypogyna]